MTRKQLTQALVFVLAMTVAAPALAQCRKQIVVYLDVSGSMRNSVNGTTPFAETMDALRTLVEQPDFVREEDELQIRLFGNRVDPSSPARGLRAIREAIESFSRNPRSDSLSDFGPVFEDMIETVSGDQGFDRQLVIVASDLVHEPFVGNPEPWLRDWSQLMGDRQASLVELFGDRTQRELLLLRAPAIKHDQVAERVERDLRNAGLIESEQVVPVGAGVPDELAAEIHRRFLTPIQIEAWPRRAGERFEVHLTNRGCYPQTVDRLSFICNGGDPIPVELPGDDLTLEPVGSDRNRSVIYMPFERLDACGAGVTDYGIRLLTKEERISESSVDLRNSLTYEAGQAWVEQRVVGHSLVIYLRLQGQSFSDDRREMEIRDGGSGALIGRPDFELPTSLEPDQPKLYQFRWNGWKPYFSSPPETYRVAIEGAETTGGGDEIEVPAALGTAERVYGLGRLVVLLLVWVALILYARKDKRLWLPLLVSAPLLPFFDWCSHWLRIPGFQRWSWERGLIDLGFGMLLAVGLFFVVQKYYSTQLDKVQLDPVDPPDELAQALEADRRYRSLAGRGVWAWWAAAAALLMVLALSFGVIRSGPVDQGSDLSEAEFVPWVTE